MCIQITSNNRQAKKDSTISKFISNNHNNKFSTLIILFLSLKKPLKNNILIPKTNYEDYSIVDLCNLIERKCKQSELLKIRDILFQKYTDIIGTNAKKNEKPSHRNFDKIEKEFLRTVKLEKELKEELLIKNSYNKDNFEELTKNPYLKFKSSRFILRSIADETYPNVEDNSHWERTFMYDFYEKGILIWIGALIGYKAVINSDESWYVKDPLSQEFNLQKGSREVDLRILGKLPYKNIVYYKFGDEYYSDYHLYCKYVGINASPYEEIIYLMGNKLGYYFEELDIEKKIPRPEIIKSK